MSSSASSGRKRKVIPKVADDLDEVMSKCRALKKALRQKKNKKLAEDIQPIVPDSKVSSNSYVEVDELSSTEVLEGIEDIALGITRQVLDGKGFSMEIPSRAASNQVYVKEWDRIVLGGKRLTRTFLNVRVSTVQLPQFLGTLWSANTATLAHCR